MLHFETVEQGHNTGSSSSKIAFPNSYPEQLF
jgi:hypothetical protein